jgi:hypothetical protein
MLTTVAEALAGAAAQAAAILAQGSVLPAVAGLAIDGKLIRICALTWTRLPAGHGCVQCIISLKNCSCYIQDECTGIWQ